MSPEHLESCYDAVIVGAGAAGLSAALGLLRATGDGPAPSLLVVSKLPSLRAHTGSAEGGIAAGLGSVEHDDWHWHYYDTVKGGDWLVDQDAAALLARQAPDAVRALERQGVAFSRTSDGHIDQRRFGGHTKDFGGEPVRRAAYAADRIGHQILHALWQQCVEAGVTFAEDWTVTDLVLADGGSRAAGVVAFDTRTGTTHAIRAHAVLLATGGAGRLFHTTSNSWDLTGDGMALALDAGLQLEDMEFLQFHPTGLAHTGILLSEAARAEGGVLRNASGEAFMARYAPGHADLAARDVVSRSIVAETDAGRGVADPRDPDGPRDCVWLDMTAIGRDRIERALPQVAETIRRYAGLDPAVDLVPVKPTAHYTMGGIPVTVDGQVYRWSDGDRRIVDGLYAAGECSCVSVHGANRLGGNSLLDACLFGTRAGTALAAFLAGASDGAASDGAVEDDAVEDAARRRRDLVAGTLAGGDDADGAAADNPYALAAELGRVMERAAAVRCDEASLRHALDLLRDDLAPRAAALRTHEPTAAFNQELVAIGETRHLMALASTMLSASLARHESRGSLFRTDFPQRDDDRFLAHSMTDAAGGISWQPVHIVDMPPQARAY